MFFSGNGRRRQERRRRGITLLRSHRLPALPVPLFLYNSGEYFYLLFSKGRFFSSLIVETHFLWKKRNILKVISSYPAFLHWAEKTTVTVNVDRSFFSPSLLSLSKWEEEGQVAGMSFTQTAGHLTELVRMTNIPLALWGIFLCVCVCVTCNVCLGREGWANNSLFIVYKAKDYL